MQRFLFLIAFLFISKIGLCQVGEFTQFFFEDGKVASEGILVNGKPDGYWKTYYPNGKLKSAGNRKDFLLDSVWVFYTEDGIISQEVTYALDVKNGKKNTYDEAGLLNKTEYFKNDIRSLKAEYFYANGKLKEFIPIDTIGKGKEQGIGYEYDEEDGRIISVIKYGNGYVSQRERINRKDKFNQSQGLWKTFYANLVCHTEGKYKNDKKDGYWKEYDTLGNLIETLKFDDGILINDPEELAKLDIKKKFHPNAQVKSEGSYNKGVEEGIHRFYSLEGKIESSKIYRKGKIVGEGIVDAEGRKQGDWREFYETGELRSKGKYKDNRREGLWIFYYLDGKIEQEGNYRIGRPDGDWKWYYKNGQTWREEIFYEGLEEGIAIEYSDTGTVVAKGEYLTGEREGAWIIDVGNHREEGEYRIGMRNGIWKYFYRNEKIKFEGKYVDGMEEGIHNYYYPSGQLKQSGRYKFGEKEGDWVEWNEDGTLKMTVTYQRGVVLKVDGNKAPVLETTKEEE